MNFDLSLLSATPKQLGIILDVFLVYFVIYRFLIWAQHSRVFNLIKGLFWLFLIYPISQFLGLTTAAWLLGKFTTVLILLIIIIFQPELRRFLDRLGTSLQLFSPLLLQTKGQGTVTIKNVLKSVDVLVREKVGALIVIEKSTNLSEFIDSGIKLNANISPDLLSGLFWPGSPTHDGAIIIREDKIEAASCLLPLSDAPIDDRRLGTRHRAALGLSEITDALIIVISEETGIISIAENGDLTRYLNKEALESRLFNLYKSEESILNDPKSFFQFLSIFKKRQQDEV